MDYNSKFICDSGITQSKFFTHQLTINSYINQFNSVYVCVKYLLKGKTKEESKEWRKEKEKNIYNNKVREETWGNGLNRHSGCRLGLNYNSASTNIIT